MTEPKWRYGIRPAVEFHHARGSRRTGNAMLDKVCIIGAFPTVSDSILRFTSWSEAVKALNIEPDVNDVYSVTDASGNIVKNSNVYDGAVALRWAFMQGSSERGASEVLVCNISTQELLETNIGTTEEPNKVVAPHCENGVEVLNTTLTHDPLAVSYGLVSKQDKLDILLSKLKYEEFDSIIFAYDLNKELGSTYTYGEITTTTDGKETIKDSNKTNGMPKPILERLLQLKKFTHDSYNLKNPIGLYIGLKITPEDTTSAKTTTTNGHSVVDSLTETNKSKNIDKNLAEKYLSIFSDPVHNAHSLYCMVFDGLDVELRPETLTPLETAAYLCGVESGLPVDTIMGQRTLPHVTGVPEELNYDPTYKDSADEQNDGIHLLANGATVFECINRANNEWAIVNSRLPCGFDISHLRTSAYIIKQIALTPFLCKINNDVTRESVDSVIASLKDRYTERFANVISIDHHIAEKRAPYCIEIYLYINFWGIIINECVYVAMGVEEDGY